MVKASHYFDLVTTDKKKNLTMAVHTYSVCLNFIAPSKELCSKTASGEVGV